MLLPNLPVSSLNKPCLKTFSSPVTWSGMEVDVSSCSVGITGFRRKSSSDSRENGQQLDGSYWCLRQTLVRELNVWRTELISPKLTLSGWENRNKRQSSSFWCLTWRRLLDSNVCIKESTIRVFLGCRAMGIWDLGTEANIWLGQTRQEGHPALCNLNQSTTESAEQSQELFREKLPMCDQLASVDQIREKPGDQ